MVLVEPASTRLSILDRIAGAVLLLEALLGVVVTVGYVLYAVLTDVGDLYYWGAAIVAGIMTAGIGLVVRGWLRRRRFANGAAFATQLLYGAAGVWFLGANLLIAVPLIAGAVIVAVAAMKRISSVARAQAQD